MDVDRPPPSPSPSSSVKAARQPGRPRQKPDSHANNYCARHKFVRPPPSCVPRRAPNRAATSLAPSAASRAASSASGSATVAHKAAGTAPLAGEGAPRLAVASGGRLSSLVAAAPHNQLIALGLVVALVGSGLFIARLCKHTPKMTGSRANQKKKDSALRKIVQAQEAASKGDEGASRPSGSGANARGASGSSSKNGAADSTADADVAVSRPTLARINTAVGESLAAAVELLPSPSCVASGSSIIWSGLERLSDVIGATHSRTRSGSTSAPASSKGKGRQTEQPDEAEPVGISSSLQMRRRSSSRAGTMTPPNADVSVRKGKNKKGKNASSALMSPTQSTHLPSTAISSPAISRRGSARTDPNFVSEQGAQREAVVQTVASSRSATLRGGIPPNTRQPHADETARTERGRVSSVPMRHMTEASVQTSPRLLPLPASPALAARDTSSSAAAMPVSERTLPSFDLHASFQAMPALPPGASSLGGLDTYSITRAAPYGRPASPPMSISLSRSPSAAASASSGSPNSRRASSPSIGPSPNSHVQPLPMTSDRRSSTVSVNGHLAVNTPERAASSGGSSPAASNSRSRKAVRKANGLDAGSSGVVGLPGAVAAPRRSGEADRKPDRGRSAGPKGAKSPKLEAASVALERRSSTASSVASAGSGSNALFAAHANSGTDPPPLPDWHRQRAAKLGHAPLGVDPRRDYDDARSEGGSDLGRRSSSVMGEGYVPPAEFDLRNGQGASPESSPHPSQRSLPSSHQPFGHPYAPWSPQLGPQQAATMASPSSTNASRPPSRGSSLSVPVAMTPLAASAAQQQQAFALAQAQLQTQTQLMQHYQQIAAMQLQQRQAQAHGVPTLRRRATSGALSETSDGLLSPVGTATPATPHGFNPPFASPTLGGSTGNAPTWSAPYSSQPSPQHIGPPSPYLGLSQTSSPTTVSFPPSSAIPQIPPQTVHSHPHANGSWPHVNGGPTGYLASPAMVYGQMQPSPSHAYFSHSQNPMPPAQQQRNNSMPYSTRPRLSSSVSTGGPSTGAGKGGTSGSTSTPSGKTRNGAERSHSIPSVPLSGGVPLGDAPPSGWKGKLKQAEQDADRMSKELEIARWRLVVVEEEQRAAERESQEALKVLAARAMRAEARIKLFETTSQRGEADDSASRATRAASPATSVPNDSSDPTASSGEYDPPQLEARAEPTALPMVADENVPELQLNGSTGVDESLPSSPVKSHPLNWLDLDAVSFEGARSLRQPDSQASHVSPNLAASRRRNGRSSHGYGELGRRRPNAGGRRKSSGLPVPAPPVAAEAESSGEEEEVLIVLDTNQQRRRPGRLSASRRPSLMDDEGPESGAEDEDVPPIEADYSMEPLTGGQLSGDGVDDYKGHAEYIGFLPSYLSAPRSVVVLPDESKLDPAVHASPPVEPVSP